MNMVGHQVALLDADAVLAGQNAADLDAEPQDVVAERLRAFQFAGLVGVIEDQRMQIAVAGVEDIGDAQAVLRRPSASCAAARRPIFLRGYRAVHAVIVGRQASDGREGGLAPGPEQQPLLLGLAGAAGGRAVARGDRLNRCDS